MRYHEQLPDLLSLLSKEEDNKITLETIKKVCAMHGHDPKDNAAISKCIEDLSENAQIWEEYCDIQTTVRKQDIIYSKLCFLATNNPQYLSSDVLSWKRSAMSGNDIIEEAIMIAIENPDMNILDALDKASKFYPVEDQSADISNPSKSKSTLDDKNKGESELCNYSQEIKRSLGSLPSTRNISCVLKPSILLGLLQSGPTRTDINTLMKIEDIWGEVDKTIVWPWLESLIKKHCQGTSINSVSKSQLDSMTPKLEEINTVVHKTQRSIDKMERIITINRNQLEDLDDKLKSIILNLTKL